MRIGADDETLVRRNLTLPGRTAARIDHLRRRLQASSDSEIVRQALRYLAELVEDQSRGTKFIVSPKGRCAHEINLTTLDDSLEGDIALVRRNILVHQASIDRLEQMKILGDIKSDSEAVRMALKYYNLLVDEVERGSQFFVVEGNSKIQVRLAGLSPSRPPDDRTSRHQHNLAPTGS